MIRTCANCKYYHACLSEGHGPYHIHNYCEKLNRVVGKDSISNLVDFLTTHEVEFNMIEEAECIYDDFECGLFGCSLFEEDIDRDMELRKHLESNLDTAFKMLDIILKDNMVWMVPELGKRERVSLDDSTPYLSRKHFLGLKEQFECLRTTILK